MDGLMEAQRDPARLYEHFFGGSGWARDKETGRIKPVSYKGIFDKVRVGIGAALREYRPSMRTSSVMGMSTRKGHESYADVGGLNTYLRDWLYDFGDLRPGKHRTWLEEHPPPDPPRVLLTREDVAALLGMVQSSVRYQMRKAEMNLLTDEEVEGLLGLSAAFKSFLSDACSHRSRTIVKDAWICRGCGYQKVEESA